MEPKKNGTITDASLPHYSVPEQPSQNVGNAAPHSYRHRNVTPSGTLKRIPDKPDSHDNYQSPFTSLQKMHVGVTRPKTGLMKHAADWIAGLPAPVPNTSPQPPVPDTDPTPETEQGGVIAFMNNWFVKPVADYLVSPIKQYLVKPAANLAYKPVHKYLVEPVKCWSASKTRELLEDQAGISFEMDDALWQQLFQDALMTAIHKLDPKKLAINQTVTIPRITIDTADGPVEIINLKIAACLQPPCSECTLIGSQKKQVSIKVRHASCTIKVPGEDEQGPVQIRLSANKGNIHLGTDLGDLVNLQSAERLRMGDTDGLSDNTAMQFSFEEVKVDYSNTQTVYDLEGNYVPAEGDDPVLADFNKGSAVVKNVTFSRPCNLFRNEPDQSTIMQLGSVKVTSPPHHRLSVVSLNDVALNNLDDDHNGTLEGNITLNPEHLGQSSSMLMRLLGILLGGTTKISILAPIKKGDIALQDMKYSKKQRAKMEPGQASQSGFIDVTSTNPIIRAILGPLLRSGFIKIAQSPQGPALQIGRLLHFPLPGLIPGDPDKNSQGKVVVSELFSQIGGDQLKEWMFTPSRVFLCPKTLEKQCVSASRGSLSDARALFEQHKILTARRHYSEAQRACLAIPVATYKTLIQECENPDERAEYYTIAHELTELDPPKSVSIYAALLKKQQYAEEPEMADPKWLIQLALDLETKEDEANDEQIVDMLAFAYKADPFEGSEGMVNLCRLVSEQRCESDRVVQLLLGHIRSGKFEGSPQALAQTIIAVAPVIGDKIAVILSEMPVKSLADQAKANQEARSLIDEVQNLMLNNHLPVSAAQLYLMIDETLNAEAVLEEAIDQNDATALQERISKEVNEGVMGHPRFESAAKLLVETLTKDALPDPMKTMGDRVLSDLWNKAHSNPAVANAFCDAFASDVSPPFRQALLQLFSFSINDTLDSPVFINKIHAIRALFIEAWDDQSITEPQQIMISHFANLLNNLQAPHDGIASTLAYLSQNNNTSEKLNHIENMLSSALLPMEPQTVRSGSGYQTNIPQWLQVGLTRSVAARRKG